MEVKLSPMAGGFGLNQAKPQSKAQEAAAQFEALIVTQLLRAARPSGFAGEENSGGDAVADFSEQQLSQALASSGGLGLARLISENLERIAETPQAEPTGPTAADAKR